MPPSPPYSSPLPFPILFLLYRFLYVCVRSLFLKFIDLFFLYFHVRVNALSVVYIITARSSLCSSRVLQHIIVHTNRSFSRGNFRCICTTDFLFTCTISRCLLHFFLSSILCIRVCVCFYVGPQCTKFARRWRLPGVVVIVGHAGPNGAATGEEGSGQAAPGRAEHGRQGADASAPQNTLLAEVSFPRASLSCPQHPTPAS